jgi:RNA polymerase sigma-70 factor (ECF subfamily)
MAIHGPGYTRPGSWRLRAGATLTESEITVLLERLTDGDRSVANELARIVYGELHRIADLAMRRERPDHTLQPTLLVSEAFLKLVGQRDTRWQNRAQFFAVAAQAIRRILIDHARARRRVKRDFGLRVTLDASIAETPGEELDVLDINAALVKLETVAPRQARVVELRYFGGLEVEATAEALGISPATVKRDWTFARAFMLRELQSGR